MFVYRCRECGRWLVEAGKAVGRLENCPGCERPVDRPERRPPDTPAPVAATRSRGPAAIKGADPGPCERGALVPEKGGDRLTAIRPRESRAPSTASPVEESR